MLRYVTPQIFEIFFKCHDSLFTSFSFSFSVASLYNVSSLFLLGSSLSLFYWTIDKDGFESVWVEGVVGSGISLKCPGEGKHTRSVFYALCVFPTCISSPNLVSCFMMRLFPL